MSTSVDKIGPGARECAPAPGNTGVQTNAIPVIMLGVVSPIPNSVTGLVNPNVQRFLSVSIDWVDGSR